MGLFELPNRFWEKVDRTGGAQDCWEWKAGKIKDGYGMFAIKGTWCLTHRLVMESCGVDIDGLVVRHLCDNPSCVNIFHLAVGTHADNCRDKIERGRMGDRKGSKNGHTTLTESAVLRIRKLYSELPRGPKGRVQKGAGRQFAVDCGLTYRTLSKIVWRQSWKHI